jgi:hypothetical protein
MIEEDEKRSARREPSLDEATRTLGLTVEEVHADREDLVEAAISQVEILKGRDKELRFAGLDVHHVPARGGLDHLRRAVYCGEMAFFEAFANESRRDPVPAPDLEHLVTRPDVQLLDDRAQPLAHYPASRPVLVIVASQPPGHSRAPVTVSPP